MLQTLHKNGKITWIKYVQDILHKYGFEYIWEQQNVPDKKVFLKMFLKTGSSQNVMKNGDRRYEISVK